ncbi:hypothetical protein [Xylophilus sp. Leaf220]|uniref:hypothetical protein n=1 Tax=Xylophilus sp. Leaf220 TaxID=1735686 RepID=UPI0006F6D2D0|nr:hypothetical protein [Xylophilus sp. Leaf220]KQM68770.1 hypothetical protein ASE76_13820 [Xylophilus sp. Leaf220]
MKYALINDGFVVNTVEVENSEDGRTFLEAMAEDFEHVEALDTPHEQGLGVGIGWGWADSAFVAPAAAEPAPVMRPTVYTKTDFRKLLTDGENVLVDNFNFAEFVAETPAIKNLTVAQRAGVRSAIARYKDAIDIDRTDPTTVEFIGALGALGLLDGPERSGEILTGEFPMDASPGLTPVA